MSMIWREFRKLAIERAVHWDSWTNRERQEHMEKMAHARSVAMKAERDLANGRSADV